MLPVTEIVLPQLASSVPAFLAKLWKMVDDPDTDHLISWGDLGNSFLIHNQAEFSQSLLPYYYKHSNMASFVRQLNMYGFHKVVGVEAGGLKSEKDQEMEFAHPCFLRGQEGLLSAIKRKVATSKGGASGGVSGGAAFTPSIKQEKVTEVLNEVSQLRDKQEDMDSKLESMKKENEALWREVITLRQKHQSQQKIVNKLIHFLMSYLQRTMHPGNAVKRRFQQPLAIESRGSKESRFDPGSNSNSNQGGSSTMAGSTVSISENMSGEGPVIFDVTHNDEGLFDDNNYGTTPTVTSPQTPTKAEAPMSPLSMAMQAVDPSLVNPAISINRSPNSFNILNLISNSSNASTSNSPTTSAGGRPVLQREISKEDFDVETMLMQKELDNLKDILSGQITLDSNIISNLFSPNENHLGFYGSASPGKQSQQSLQPLEMDYDSNKFDDQPTLFELADIEDGGVLMPPPSNTGSFGDEDPYLETNLQTPIVTLDTLDTNPLLAQITRSKKKKSS